MSSTLVLDPTRIRDLRPEALGETGHVRILPTSYWAGCTTDERAVFALRTAAYLLPTEELVAWLQAATEGRQALEIGAGNGVLAQAVGIRATDNWMQAAPEIQAHYKMMRQPVVDYGAHVEKLSAEEALETHKPEVVVPLGSRTSTTSGARKLAQTCSA